MDGNVGWTDTEADANEGFVLFPFLKKIFVDQKKKIWFEKGMNYGVREPVPPHQRRHRFGSHEQILQGQQFNNPPL